MASIVETRLNLDAVTSFAVFADSLNFSAAATRLHISQPALHVKVRKLSEQMGLPLYRRAGRNLVLTEHGERLARFGREVAARTHAFAAEIEGRAERRQITLAAGEGGYLYLLGDGIRRFLKDDIADLRLVTRDREGALDAVLSGRADVGVAPMTSIPATLEARTLTTVGQMLVVPAGHALAKRRRIGLEDLAGCALIVPPEDRPHRRMLDQMLQTAGVPWKVAMEASGWELMLRFVQIGIGAAVVNACCTLPRGLKGVAIPELPTLRYDAFHLKGAAKSEPVARLLKLLREHAEDWKAGRVRGHR